VPRLKVLFDANVLYPAPLRDLLVQLALTDLFQAHWSAMIHDEWIRNVVADRPDLNPAQIGRVADLMNSSVEDALITGFEHLIDTLELPDSDDRHVLAAAIVGRASIIVTNNQKDFPISALEPHGIMTQNADDFVLMLLEMDLDAVLFAVNTVQKRLRKPPVTMLEYLNRLEQLRLYKTVDALRILL
jgi:predicted nucleic acid-binding protein